MSVDFLPEVYFVKSQGVQDFYLRIPQLKILERYKNIKTFLSSLCKITELILSLRNCFKGGFLQLIFIISTNDQKKYFKKSKQKDYRASSFLQTQSHRDFILIKAHPKSDTERSKKVGRPSKWAFKSVLLWKD